ncbi:ABC transporter permease [Spirosoma arcticum]
MIELIARKEIRDLLRDRRYRLVGLVLLLLVGIGFVTAGQTVARTNAERIAAQQLSREGWLNQPPKNPHSAAHFGNFAFRLKTPLSLFDNGLDSYTGTSVFLEPHKQDDFKFSQAEDATSIIRFGELTPAFVLQFILPLLIVFLCFDSVSREKEMTTLPLLLSQGVSLQQVVIGKIAGYWLLISGLLAPVFGALLLGLVWQTLPAPGDIALRFSLLLLSYVLYAGILVTVSVVCSAFSLTSRASLMKLLGLWMLACVVVPKVTSNLGSTLVETPSQYAYAKLVKHDEENGLDGHDPHDARRAVLLKQLLSQYGVDSAAALPINFDAVAMVESEKYTTQIYRKRIGDVRYVFAQQNRLGQLAGFVNPFQAVQGVSMALCGTDYAQFTHFQDETEQYRLYFVNAMNEFMATHTKSGDWKTRFGPEAYRAIRPFTYAEPPVGWAIRQQGVACLALTGWLLICFGLIYLTRTIPFR